MLLTKEDFKSYINYSKDTFDNEIDVLIAGAESFIARYCNNVIEQETISEIFDGDDISSETGNIFLSNNLNLSNVVISKWNSQTTTWDAIVDVYGSQYYLYDKEGRIALNSVTSGKKNYKVDYKAGYLNTIYDPMPSDLKIAILKITNKYWNKRRSDGIQSESLDSSNLSYDQFLSDDIKLILDKYTITLI